MIYFYRIPIITSIICSVTLIADPIKLIGYTIKDNYSLSHRFLHDIKNAFNIECFVETGTLSGGTTLRSADIFPEVHTIELSADLYERTAHQLRQRQNIFPYLGESTEVLAKILPTIAKKNIAFFLDAHYSGGVTARGIDNTPLAREIMLIGSHYKDAVIIIDDIRLCQSDKNLIEKQYRQPEGESVYGYPSLTEIKNILLIINPSYTFIIWGDMGIAYPHDKYPHVASSEIIQAMTASRMFDEVQEHSDEQIKELLKTESLIVRASGDEALAIKDLLNKSKGLCFPEVFTMHYSLWAALLGIGECNYHEAERLLNHIERLGFSHWRVRRYKAMVYRLAGKERQARSIENQLKAEIKFQIG